MVAADVARNVAETLAQRVFGEMTRNECKNGTVNGGSRTNFIWEDTSKQHTVRSAFGQANRESRKSSQTFAQQESQ